MADPRPVFDQLNIVAGAHHVSAQRSMADSQPVLDIDSIAFARVWNTGWRQDSNLAGRVVVVSASSRATPLIGCTRT